MAYALLVHFHPQLGLAPLLYLAYAAAFILLPAYACSKLLPQENLGVAERVCLGFPISQALLFVLAWGGSRLGLSWWGALLLPALGLYGLCDLIRTRGGQRSEPFFLVATAALTTLSLALCFRYFLFTSLPGEGVPVSIFMDDAYLTVGTFSAAKALLSGLPFMEGSLGDIPFAYHILMQANNAVAHLATGIHPLMLQLYIFPVLHWLLLAGAVVAGARRLAGFDRKQTVLAACLLLYASGVVFEANSWIQMFGHFHTYFFGLPGTILLGMLLFGVLTGRVERFPGIYGALLFLFVCGAKGVPLVLVPLSLLPVFAYRLLRRKVGRADISFTLGVLVSGVLLRLIEYTSFGQVTLKKFNLLNSSLELFINFMELMPFVLLACIIAAQNRLSRHKIGQYRQYAILVATMFAACIILTRAIDFIGGHQYFFWYFRVFFFILIAACLGHAFEQRKKLLSAASVAVVLLAMFAFAFNASRLIRSNSAHGNTFNLSRLECDGLLWAYGNLAHSSRILSNGAYGYSSQNGVQTPFGPQDYLVLSGLYGYAWPYEWLPDGPRQSADARLKVADGFWKADSLEERQVRLANIPVDYLFIRKREDRSLDYTGLAGARRIYSNEDFDIYALRNVPPHN